MGLFVSADWIESNLDSPDVFVLDPRRTVEYLQGHMKRARSLPLTQAFDGAGRLLAVAELERWLGAAGLDEKKTFVVYDSADGRRGAMLTWILLYLGCRKVHLMDVLWERWVAEGREIFYRPVPAIAARFTARVEPHLRARRDDVRAATGARLVDFRSREEFTGEADTEGRPGHIPGAVNMVWQELLGPDHEFLASKEKLQQAFARAGISPRDRVIAYCRSGLRAAIGCAALMEIGIPVSLYDGSYADWAASGLPVETSTDKQE